MTKYTRHGQPVTHSAHTTLQRHDFDKHLPAAYDDVHLRLELGLLARHEQMMRRHNTPNTDPAVLRRIHTTTIRNNRPANRNEFDRNTRGMMPNTSNELA